MFASFLSAGEGERILHSAIRLLREAALEEGFTPIAQGGAEHLFWDVETLLSILGSPCVLGEPCPCRSRREAFGELQLQGTVRLGDSVASTSPAFLW